MPCCITSQKKGKTVKILQINMEKGWRGGESQTLLSMMQFRHAGHEVELLARHDEPLSQRAEQNGFKVFSYKKSYLFALFLLLGKAYKYDIIHCQTANSLTWAAILKWCFKGKLVYTRRTAFPIKTSKESRTKKKWDKTDLFVGVTRASMDEAIRLGVINSVMSLSELIASPKQQNKANLVIPSATVPQPFNEQSFQHIISSQPIENKKIIGVVAALTAEKAPLVQIEAIHQLYQKRQDFAVLHFGSGNMLEECQAKVKELGLEKIYIFMGFQDNIEQLFKGFDCYLLTSRFEGANNGIINSFFNEVPVVSTASGGPNDLIGVDEKRGYLCPIDDSTALATALYKALDNDAETRQRVQHAKEYAQATHTAKIMGNHYLTAYEALLI